MNDPNEANSTTPKASRGHVYPKHFPPRPLNRDAHVNEILTADERQSLTIAWVYRFYDADHAPLYIGMSGGRPTRFDQHRKTAEWWPLAEYVALSIYRDCEAADIAEKAAIREEQPRFNRLGKWRTYMTVRLDKGAEHIADEIHRLVRPEVVRELAELLAAPERFPQPAPPPHARFAEEVQP